jgi:hypothetical protein
MNSSVTVERLLLFVLAWLTGLIAATLLCLAADPLLGLLQLWFLRPQGWSQTLGFEWQQ